MSFTPKEIIALRDKHPEGELLVMEQTPSTQYIRIKCKKLDGTTAPLSIDLSKGAGLRAALEIIEDEFHANAKKVKIHKNTL